MAVEDKCLEVVVAAMADLINERILRVRRDLDILADKLTSYKNSKSYDTLGVPTLQKIQKDYEIWYEKLNEQK